MCLESEGGNLTIRVNGTYGWGNPALINTRLKMENPEFQQYILRHLWLCTACSPKHLGKFSTVLDKRRRVCCGGGIGFRWINPERGDTDAIKKCMAIRCAIIDELKRKE